MSPCVFSTADADIFIEAHTETPAHNQSAIHINQMLILDFYFFRHFAGIKIIQMNRKVN